MNTFAAVVKLFHSHIFWQPGIEAQTGSQRREKLCISSVDAFIRKETKKTRVRA